MVYEYPALKLSAASMTGKDEREPRTSRYHTGWGSLEHSSNNDVGNSCIRDQRELSVKKHSSYVLYIERKCGIKGWIPPASPFASRIYGRLSPYFKIGVQRSLREKEKVEAD